MCHGNSQPTEAHAQDHVVGSVVAVASAVAGKKSLDGFPAEDHAGGSRQERELGEEPWGGSPELRASA